MNPTFNPLRNSLLATVGIATMVMLEGRPASAQGQCGGEIRGEVVALETIGDSILAATFPKAKMVSGEASNGAARQNSSQANGSTDTTPPSQRLRDALGDAKLYLGGLQPSGSAMPCLLERRELYRVTVANALPKDESKLTEAEVRNALRAGSAAVLSTRYSPTDRIGVLFGLGFSVLGANDAVRYKVINRSVTENNVQVTRQFIVEESESQSIPVATTGLAVRFRERDSNRRWRFKAQSVDPSTPIFHNNVVWLVDHLIPTTLFGSVQFGDNDVGGVVNGTALGLGWRVIGDVNVLIGISISRSPTLRDDLESEFLKSATPGMMPLPQGETQETILGTQSEQGLLFALAMPISLKPVFGSR